MSNDKTNQTGITATMIKEVRDRLDVGIRDCIKALIQSRGDVLKALEILQRKGFAMKGEVDQEAGSVKRHPERPRTTIEKKSRRRFQGVPLIEHGIRERLDSGSVAFSRHAEQEMVKDSITVPDCRNVLRAGLVEPETLETWRHRVRTGRFYVVVAFRSMTKAVVLTAWRR